MRNGLVAIAAVLVLAGCGNSNEIASGTVTDGNGDAARYSVKQDGATTTTTVTTDEGTAVVRTGDAEAALPPGLALYPGAKLTSSTTVEGGGADKSGTILSFESPDSPGEITAFYKAAAQKAGYAIEGEVKMGEMEMLGGKSGDKGFNLTVNRTGAVSSATLIAGAGR